MASTPEGKVKRWVKGRIADYLANTETNMYVNWPVPAGYGESMLDMVGCYFGYFFMIETKAPGEVMTDRQKQCAERVKAAGGRVFVIDRVDDTRMVDVLMFFDRARMGRL